ncbi:hypothetical protein OZD68_05610 [Wolbachia endosymbiont of Drosophila bicornuta]|uniref:hypothetical protein n=1 Tax=Wolbachia TaxID=953 RepID=UPI0015F872F9|nr:MULTISPECIES: hypothetical protein [Wolbachia]MDE5057036.1 hypothetical protein [Wolbachia endosymbiont of Drosophila bicornuta]
MICSDYCKKSYTSLNAPASKKMMHIVIILRSLTPSRKAYIFSSVLPLYKTQPKAMAGTMATSGDN